MFRPTRVLYDIFRGNLTSKRGNKNYYKGRGVPSMGKIVPGTDKFRIDPKKWAENTFKVPDLTNFELRPYVAVNTPKRLVKAPELIVKPSANKDKTAAAFAAIACMVPQISQQSNH